MATIDTSAADRGRALFDSIVDRAFIDRLNNTRACDEFAAWTTMPEAEFREAAFAVIA